MLLAYDKYMYQETPNHIAEYRRRGCYNINIVRNMGQVYRLARLVGRLRYTDNIFMGNARIVRGNKDFKN